MNEITSVIKPIEFKDGVLRMLDQRELPQREIWLEINSSGPLLDAIRTLAVRGAPLLGITAAYGVLIGLGESSAESPDELRAAFTRVQDAIAITRPTARNLFESLERMAAVVDKRANSGRIDLLEYIETEAKAIHNEEIEACYAIARNGAPLFDGFPNVLTHCNTGVLATGGIGTALGVIHYAWTEGNIESVFVDETRPFLQGARLTAWELGKIGIPYRIICDNAAASVMSRGRVDAVITGADRIAANGDTANKIGTLNLAILCRYFGIPFYIAAPTSTVDSSIKDGGEIEIEMRGAHEVRGWRDIRWAEENAKAENPAFDVTPAGLITAIITEKGVIINPNERKLARFVD